MKRTAVMLLPLKLDSPLFGVEALMAGYLSWCQVILAWRL